MSVKFSNNGHSTLAASLTSSATSITLASGHGARFPSLSSGEYFYATLIDASNNLEIVKCTARSSDVLTVTRAQEGTTARAYAIGDRIELRVTAQGLVDLADSVDLTTLSATNLTSGTVPYARQPAGSIVQVVHGRLSTTVVATGLSSANYVYDIGLSASITPKSASNNIIIDVSMYVGGDAAASSAYLQSYYIYKGGSELTEALGDAVGSREQVTGSINMYNAATGAGVTYRLAYLGGRHADLAVGSTSSQTYSVHTRSYSSGPDIYINRSEAFQLQGTNYDHVPQSTITLTEVVA